MVEQYPRLTAEILDEVVQETRQRGFSVNRGLNFPGSWGIGVTITDPKGIPIAALSIATVEGGWNRNDRLNLQACSTPTPARSRLQSPRKPPTRR